MCHILPIAVAVNAQAVDSSYSHVAVTTARLIQAETLLVLVRSCKVCSDVQLLLDISKHSYFVNTMV